MGQPFTIFLDPNYDPPASYPQLEGWLLVYDHIFLGAPSPWQVYVASRHPSAPPVDQRAIERLVRRGWVIPVGRRRFFDRAWRLDRAADLRNVDPVRSQHFAWAGQFDEVIAAHARYLDDVGLDAAVAAASQLEERHPAAFEELKARVAVLKHQGLLPAKFYTASEIARPIGEITHGVIYEVAGDLWARAHLRATGVIVPSGNEGLYRIFDDAPHTDASPLQTAVEQLAAPASPDLGAEDARLARELAERLAANYTISDVLEEYRASGLQRELRTFVFCAMEAIRGTDDAGRSSDALWKRVQEQVRHMQRVKVGAAGVFSVAAAAAWSQPEIKRFFEEGVTRRSLLAVVKVLIGGLVGQSIVGPLTERLESAVRGEADRWLALIVKGTRDRWRLG